MDLVKMRTSVKQYDKVYNFIKKHNDQLSQTFVKVKSYTL